MMTILSAVLATAILGSPADSIIVSTNWLAQHLADPATVVLQVDHDEAAYREAHIPGARYLPYMSVITSRDGLSTEVPDVAAVQALFESLGVSTGSHVVLYGPSVMVSRAFVALDYIGKSNVSVLNGGLKKWRDEGRAVSREVPRVGRGHLEAVAHPERIVTADWVRSRMGRPGDRAHRHADRR